MSVVTEIPRWRAAGENFSQFFLKCVFCLCSLREQAARFYGCMSFSLTPIAWRRGFIRATTANSGG